LPVLYQKQSMAITFQVLNAAFSLAAARHEIAAQRHEIAAQRYGIELIEGKFDLTKLEKAAAVALGDRASAELPKALVWDDLIFKRVRADLIPYRVQWPHCDLLLNQQVSHRGRCAIRTDVLHALHTEQKIAELTDTSAALYQIGLTEPESIVKVPDLLRFTGLGNSAHYIPQKQLAPPTRRASSVSVIVNYRDRPELMATCLASLAQQAITAKLEIILVDNQSHPDNRQQVERLAHELFSRPERNISVIHLTYDAPFNHSAQTNLAVEASSAEVLFMLNNDADFRSPDTLQTLSDWALTPKVASVGPQFVGEDDRLISSGVEVYPPDKKKPGGIRESTVEPLAETIRHTAGNSFACSAIARDIWFQVGGLDADAFHSQYNDTDYDLKSLTLGFSHLYIGTLKVYHQPGQSETKTREQGEKLHGKIRAKYAHFQDYAALAPVLVKLRGPILDKVLNPRKTAHAFIFYRKLLKQLRTKVLGRKR